MSRDTLKAIPRDASGRTKAARQLRSSGMTPGILYKGGDSLPFAADTLDVAAVLRHGSQLIDLDIDGEKHAGVLKSYQVHPVRGTLMHVDLQEVRMDEVVKTSVPIVLLGEAAGAKAGGVVTQLVHEVNIEATPLNLPDNLQADISDLNVGHSIHISDLVVPEGVTVLDEPEALVLSISVPRGAEAAEEGEGEEGEAGEAGGEAAGASEEGGE